MENETVVTEVTTEDKIAKLKATLEGMELLGATIPAEIKAAVTQEITKLETELAAEVAVIEVEVDGFWVKYRVELIVTALLIISHVAGLFGY